MKTIIYYDQAEFILGMQSWLNIKKSNNIFYHISKKIAYHDYKF